MFLQFAQEHGLSSIVAATSTTTAPAKSGGSATFFIFLVLIVAVYFFYLRPRRARLIAQQRVTSQINGPEGIQAGDTVITTSGIIGRVLNIDGERASVEIAPDTVIEFSKASLGRRLDPPAPDEDDRWASLKEDQGASGGSNSPENPPHGAPGHVHGEPDDDDTGGVR